MLLNSRTTAIGVHNKEEMSTSGTFTLKEIDVSAGNPQRLGDQTVSLKDIAVLAGNPQLSRGVTIVNLSGSRGATHLSDVGIKF